MKQSHYLLLFLFVSTAIIILKKTIDTLESISQFHAPQPYSFEKKQLLTTGRISGNPQIIFHDADNEIYFLKPLMRATGISALLSELMYGHVAHKIGASCQQSWIFTPNILSSEQKSMFPELTKNCFLIIKYIPNSQPSNYIVENNFNYSGYTKDGIRNWLLQEIATIQSTEFDYENLITLAALNCFFEMGDRSSNNLLWNPSTHHFIAIDNAHAFDAETNYLWTTIPIKKTPLSIKERELFSRYQKALETIIYAYPIPNDLFKIVEIYTQELKKQCPTLLENDFSAIIQSFNASIEASYGRVDAIIKQIQAELSR